MSLKITPEITSSLHDDIAFENEVRNAVSDVCSGMKPSKRALSAIMQFAATYECVKTRIGRFDMILN
ncbi:MAG: hypothetical protein MJ000_10615 [Bacteroidales bacterium]|nr:hypothetical protein [Bacteroidales bacterium]